jgi:hypothetical protein
MSVDFGLVEGDLAARPALVPEIMLHWLNSDISTSIDPLAYRTIVFESDSAGSRIAPSGASHLPPRPV